MVPPDFPLRGVLERSVLETYLCSGGVLRSGEALCVYSVDLPSVPAGIRTTSGSAAVWYTQLPVSLTACLWIWR